MTQLELNTAVAQATGESLDTVNQLGFHVADPLQPNFDPEPYRPQMIDWDTMSVTDWPRV